MELTTFQREYLRTAIQHGDSDEVLIETVLAWFPAITRDEAVDLVETA